MLRKNLSLNLRLAPMPKTKINLSDLELEFIANAALAFDDMIADEQADLLHIAEFARFLVGLYGKGADLSEDEKRALRAAYRVLG